MSLNSQIADLILERGRAQAQGDAASGIAWGGALSQIGKTIAQLPQEIRRDKIVNQEMQKGALDIQSAQRQGDHEIDVQRTRQAIDGMANDPSVLNEDGTFNIKSITAKLSQMPDGGVGPVQRLDTKTIFDTLDPINKSLSEARDSQLKYQEHKANALAGLAAGALRLGKEDGNYFSHAGSALASAQKSGLLTPDEVTQTLTQLVEHQDRIPQILGDFVAKSTLPPIKLREKESLVSALDPQTILAEGPKGDQTPEARQLTLLTKQKSGVPMTPAELNEISAYTDLHASKAARSGEDQALDAYAKSIGKTKAEDLSYAERQAFDKNKAMITSSAAFQQHVNERAYDNAHPAPVDQNKLEQEHAQRLRGALSNRSGALGIEDAKVQQANHMIALMDQNYDPKTDTYNIPRVQQTELAMGLARLVSPGGVVAQKTIDDINQATLKGDIAKAFTYATGKPFNGTTQDLVKMYRDSIIRQGQVSEQNREGEMNFIRSLAPSQLEESRRQRLEAANMNPLRQSRVATDEKGNRKLFVSLDGGKTWK